MYEKDELQKKLIDLRSVYNHSEMICDPIEYISRKKKLLNAVAEHLISFIEEIKRDENTNE